MPINESMEGEEIGDTLSTMQMGGQIPNRGKHPEIKRGEPISAPIQCQKCADLECAAKGLPI